MRRTWQIGDDHAITCEENQIQYLAEDCRLSTRGAFPYKTYLEGYYPRYWCGTDLGERPVIVFVYDNTRGITTDPGLHLERFFFGKGCGWFRWEYIRADNGELEAHTEFYRVTGPRMPFAQRCRPLPDLVDTPDIPEPPVDIPSLHALVVNVWNRFDGQDRSDPAVRGTMLNIIAWEANGFNGAGPWFLSAKPAGASAPQPVTGTRIAHDIVQYGQTGADGHFDGFDVFSDSGPIWGEAHQHNQPSRVAVEAVNPAGTGAGGGGDEDDMTIDAKVQALIAAAAAPLVARIAALEAGGGTTPTPPAGLTLPLKVAIRSERTGFYLVNDADRNEGHKVHADDRTGKGPWETWTLEQV